MAVDARPWPRFWARHFDLFLVWVCFGIIIFVALLVIGGPPLLERSRNFNAFLFWLSVLLWVPVEAILLAVWGTTPGKAILGIIVRTQQEKKLNGRESLSRSLFVWCVGFGCGILGYMQIANLIVWRRLIKTGQTPWDKGIYHVVQQQALTVARGLTLTVAFIGVFFIKMFLGRFVGWLMY